MHAFALLLFTVLSVLSSQAFGATFDEASSSRFETSVIITVSDGFARGYETRLFPASADAESNLFAEEVGQEGVLNPMRIFEGRVVTSLSDREWASRIGQVTGQEFGIRWEDLSIEFYGDPIARVWSSMDSYSEAAPASLYGAGSVLIGSDWIPFSFYSDRLYSAMGSGINDDGEPEIHWGAVVFQDIFAFNVPRDGLSYRGQITLSTVTATLIPESSSAILFGAGLALLSCSRRHS